MMTRKRRRASLLGLCLLGLGSATALVLSAMDDTLVFFYGPTDVVTRTDLATERPFRLGGMVAQDSVRDLTDGSVAFVVTDHAYDIPVIYAGILPDLFREGQGVVTEGRLRSDGVFEAAEVLAKHDENYMPAEVAEALERADPDWHRRAGATLATD